MIYEMRELQGGFKSANVSIAQEKLYEKSFKTFLAKFFLLRYARVIS